MQIFCMLFLVCCWYGDASNSPTHIYSQMRNRKKIVNNDEEEEEKNHNNNTYLYYKADKTHERTDE